MLREERRRGEECHGKTVLTEFYKEHLHRAGRFKVGSPFENGTARP